MLPPELDKLHNELVASAGPTVNVDRVALLNELLRLGPQLDGAVRNGFLPPDIFLFEVGPLPVKHCPHCGKAIP
ncbi:hypothetical protein GGD40_003700 [Paraburkholderia bryophila]|uniref:Uncharacterized protein n=1 Tax=Paraburkholderia bryophila TaxID=420952 RepID=A0A7Y9WNP9_9BURK|nr:hypothetical protein [Paraburkholderia bryophila]